MFKKSMLLIAFLILSTRLFAQDMAIGIRAGDPLAVSFKKYLSGGKNALEFNLGSYGYAYGYGNYRNGNYYGNYKHYNNYYYRRGGIVIMGDYLWHFDIPQAQGLSWYLGVGGQLRSLNYLRDRDGDGDIDDEVTGIGIGPNGVIGLEWIPKEVPEIALFLDTGLYLEIVPQPWVVSQVGLGVRYNFK